LRVRRTVSTFVFSFAAGLCICARLGCLSPVLDMLNALVAPALVLMMIAALIMAFHSLGRAAAMACLAIIISGWQVSAILANTSPAITSENPVAAIRVITVNAFRDNMTPESWRFMVEQHHPDIVVIQEADDAAGAEVQRILPGFHRANSCSMPPCSLTIVSRWPLRRIETPMPGEPRLPDILVTEVVRPVARGVQKFDVVAVHLPRSYRPEAAHFHALLIQALEQRLTAPAIVAGDFNLPSGSFVLDDISRATALLRIDRWIATYPANTILPAIAAIDHIFADPAFGSAGCERLPAAGSDHHGILCTIDLHALPTVPRTPLQIEPQAREMPL
jgi:endonuclease/exonuclease/phosphatase (EEP) superfamily protein YafD